MYIKPICPLQWYTGGCYTVGLLWILDSVKKGVVYYKQYYCKFTWADWNLAVGHFTIIGLDSGTCSRQGHTALMHLCTCLCLCSHQSSSSGMVDSGGLRQYKWKAMLHSSHSSCMCASCFPPHTQHEQNRHSASGSALQCLHSGPLLPIHTHTGWRINL